VKGACGHRLCQTSDSLLPQQHCSISPCYCSVLRMFLPCRLLFSFLSRLVASEAPHQFLQGVGSVCRHAGGEGLGSLLRRQSHSLASDRFEWVFCLPRSVTSI